MKAATRGRWRHFGFPLGIRPIVHLYLPVSYIPSEVRSPPVLTWSERGVEEACSCRPRRPVWEESPSVVQHQSVPPASPRSPRWTEEEAVAWGVCWPGGRGARGPSTAGTAGCG